MIIINEKNNGIYSIIKRNYLTIAVLIIIFAILLILNSKTLYTADDYVYRFVYHLPTPEKHMEKITTSLIPYSMWNHYLNWNGRFVAHSIIQYFMQFNTKVPFNIFNSLAYVGLVALINWISLKITGKNNNPYMLALIFFFTWFFIPFFGQSVLWLSGSGNYLWMSLIYLGFILFNLKRHELNFTNVLSAILLGFLTGASNENSGPAAVLIVLLFMLKRFIKERKINLVTIIGVIFSAIGFLVMMLSPGSQKRGTMQRTFETIQNNFRGIFKLSFNDLKWAYLIFVVLLLITILMKKVTFDELLTVSFFFMGHLAAIYVMVFSPEHPERTFFGGTMFLGIAIFILAYCLFNGTKMIALGLVLICSIGFIVSFIPAYQDISLSYYQTENQYKAIEKAQHRNPKNATVQILTPQKSKYNATNGVIGLAKEPWQIMNRWESKFFGVNQISGYYQGQK